MGGRVCRGGRRRGYWRGSVTHRQFPLMGLIGFVLRGGPEWKVMLETLLHVLCCASFPPKVEDQTQHMHFAYRMGFCSNLTHSPTAIADVARRFKLS
ncbi:unnamed protein product [Sphenostylis stenocarpa]|uniref:Uncharacterized protein n=1 Tax=Sphenostylis stenocarpa TaxID=92480 RepID=A0AA86TG48_9FABA|nr:unnamed protein product [Sphenostylis stenocarpa]